MREHVCSASGVTVSYSCYGGGPPLVLVHGSFSDDHTNWEFVKPILQERFTIHAIARRGRGDTDATAGHSLEDEVKDVTAVIRAAGEPVFLLGHSYGAHCSVAAALAPGTVRKLVLYEPPWPHVLSRETFTELEALGAAGEWEDFAITFFRDSLFVPVEEIEAWRVTGLWPPIVADAKASLGDLRALRGSDFKPERFSTLEAPVLLQVGSESRRQLYVTDALAAVLPNAHIAELPGQAHEGMTTAPEMYAEAVTRFLLG